MKKLNLLIVILLIVVFSGCGSGGSGGDENGVLDPGNNNEENVITYSLNGVITGFTRSLETNEIGRATLQNNGGDNLELHGDRSFTFPTKLKDNESYNVTVLSDPDWQTCKVENGSGIISGSDVTNIKVKCENGDGIVPDYYKVGGTISGFVSFLQYGGNYEDRWSLHLYKDNVFTEYTPLNKNGSFQFKNPIENGSDYLVSTVITRIHHDQRCIAENNEGTIYDSDVTDIKITCESYDIKLISATRNGKSGLHDSFLPKISGDGNIITFTSKSILISSPLDIYKRHNNIYVYNQETKSMRLISSNYYNNKLEGNDLSYQTDINNSGQFIVFSSLASNLVLDDINNTTDVFIYDYKTGRKKLVSVSSTGEQGNSASYKPKISNNGRYVLFTSYASNLVANDTNDTFDRFIHDTETGETFLYDMEIPAENPGIYSSDVNSSDGKYNVSFTTIDGAAGVYVFDIDNAEKEFVSRYTNFDHAIGLKPVISKDGKYIAFYSSKRLTPHKDINGKNNDVYLVENPFLK